MATVLATVLPQMDAGGDASDTQLAEYVANTEHVALPRCMKKKLIWC
jgi:hypothetical protein